MWGGGGEGRRDERVTFTISIYRGYQQQDAHEFMRYLLDKLHTELVAGSLFAGDDMTIVSQIFGGTLQSDVRGGGGRGGGGDVM